MPNEVLRTVGQVAGIGGLALGVLLLIYRDIVRKNIFGRLSGEQSYRLFRLIVVLVWLIAIAGLAAWLAVSIPSRSPSTPHSSIRLEKDFPIKLGDSHAKVLAALGKPQDSDLNREMYFSEGVHVFYDVHSNLVDGFMVQMLDSGTVFDGATFGLRVGDTFDKAKRLLGPPEHWGIPNAHLSLATWPIKGAVLILAIAGPASSTPGIIDSVTYCKESSIGFLEPLVATSILEIKNGEQPTYLEEGLAGSPLIMDLRDKCFQQPYDIVSKIPAEAGGTLIHVQFKDDKLVVFFIYPVVWEDPRIRTILPVGADGKLSLGNEAPNSNGGTNSVASRMAEARTQALKTNLVSP